MSCERTQIIITRCYSELLLNLGHFNYSYLLTENLVLRLRMNIPEIEKICMSTISKIFKRKVEGQCFSFLQLQYSLVKLVIQILKHYFTVLKKTKPKKLPNNFIKIVTNINLKFYDTIKELLEFAIETEKKGKKKTQEKKKRIQEGKKKSYNPVDVNKIKNHLRKELKMAKATENKKISNKMQTQILQHIFALFFKVLKTPKLQKFFYDAINGILTFAHYLSVGIMKDLTISLSQCCEQLRNQPTMDNFHRRLMCIHTHYQLVNGPGTGVNIDEVTSLTGLYTCLLDLFKDKRIIQGERQQEISKLILSLLSNFFIEKRQYSVEIIGSYLSILARLVGKYKLKKKFYQTLLFTIKKILRKYSKLNRMLEEENEGFGLDAYDPDCQNPQTTNAINSCILIHLKPLMESTQNGSTSAHVLDKILTAQPLKIEISGKGILEYYHGQF